MAMGRIRLALPPASWSRLVFSCPRPFERLRVQTRLHSDAGVATQTFATHRNTCRVLTATKLAEDPEPTSPRDKTTGFGPWNREPGRSVLSTLGDDARRGDPRAQTTG